MSFPMAMLIALAIDGLVGWPDGLYRRIGHPVTWLGALIAGLDRTLNRDHWAAATRRGFGGASALVLLAATALLAWAIQALLPGGWAGTVILGVLSWPLVAARSLYDHVARVARPLSAGDVAGARSAVSMIVGRNPEQLDAAGVARAAMESLAENTSDGVVAPLFWGALAGLPGIVAYKVLNTLDSMIGHKTPRHTAFGMVAARLDDLANLVPARLTGMLFAVVSRHPGAALRTMLRDARRHRSPNAGWPEAAMAGALGIRLSGPRVYDGRPTDDPWLNAGAPDPGAEALRRGLGIFVRSLLPFSACLLLMVALVGFG